MENQMIYSGIEVCSFVIDGEEYVEDEEEQLSPKLY